MGKEVEVQPLEIKIIKGTQPINIKMSDITNKKKLQKYVVLQNFYYRPNRGYRWDLVDKELMSGNIPFGYKRV